MSQQVELDTKLFVGALGPDTTNDSLRAYYEQWGPVVDAVVMHSRGFGFVTFADKASTDRSMKATPHKIDGKAVDAKRATRKLKFGASESSTASRRIFVGGIYGKIDETDLTKYFSQFGDIKSSIIYADEVTGESRGFGFVIFADAESVDLALSVPFHMVNGIELDVRKARTKDGTASGSSIVSGFSSDAGSDYIPNHLLDKARYTPRYSTSMYPRLLSGSNFSSGGSTEARSIPVLHDDADGSHPWMSARKSVPTKSSANLKSLNEAIQAERAFSRQKIFHAEEKILELERKLILKEKECCELKEKLLYEHQRQTREMAQGVVQSYYCEPQVEQPSLNPYSYGQFSGQPDFYEQSSGQPDFYEQSSGQPDFYEQSSGQPDVYEQSSGHSYSYETAFQQGWAEFPKPGPPYWTNLSADAQEFTLDMGQNSNNLIPVCEDQDILPTNSSQSDIPGTSSEMARNRSSHNSLNERESGYSSDP